MGEVSRRANAALVQRVTCDEPAFAMLPIGPMRDGPRINFHKVGLIGVKPWALIGCTDSNKRHTTSTQSGERKSSPVLISTGNYNMLRLPERASAEEARETAGFPVFGWRRFIVPPNGLLMWRIPLTTCQYITQDVARAMREVDPSISWGKVPYNEKCGMMDRINTRLTGEGLPPVGLHVVEWRMSRVLNNLKQSEGMRFLT
jgi:hypothetical protein